MGVLLPAAVKRGYSMRYYVQISDREFEVDLSENKGGLLVRLGEKTFSLDCAEVEEGLKYSILIDGESFNVSTSPSRTSMDLIVGGHFYSVQVLDEREKGALALQGGGGEEGHRVLTSVMPGIVTKIFVSEGDPVTAGAPLLILEAMKMENELYAGKDGKVAKIHVTEGQTVNSSDPLVTLE